MDKNGVLVNVYEVQTKLLPLPPYYGKQGVEKEKRPCAEISAQGLKKNLIF